MPILQKLIVQIKRRIDNEETVAGSQHTSTTKVTAMSNACKPEDVHEDTFDLTTDSSIQIEQMNQNVEQMKQIIKQVLEVSHQLCVQLFNVFRTTMQFLLK